MSDQLNACRQQARDCAKLNRLVLADLGELLAMGLPTRAFSLVKSAQQAAQGIATRIDHGAADLAAAARDAMACDRGMVAAEFALVISFCGLACLTGAMYLAPVLSDFSLALYERTQDGLATLSALCGAFADAEIASVACDMGTPL